MTQESFSSFLLALPGILSCVTWRTIPTGPPPPFTPESYLWCPAYSAVSIPTGPPPPFTHSSNPNFVCSFNCFNSHRTSPTIYTSDETLRWLRSKHVSIPTGPPPPFTPESYLWCPAHSAVSIPTGPHPPFTQGTLEVVVLPHDVSIPTGPPPPFTPTLDCMIKLLF